VLPHKVLQPALGVIDSMIPREAVVHAGFVMAHTAAIAEALEPGDLICPFVVVTKGDNRQSIPFEAETQDQAVHQAWSSLAEYRDQIDLWAMGREGLVRGPNGKDDVLVVAAWAQGMSDAVVFTQRFKPKAQGFRLFGPLSTPEDLTAEECQVVKGWLHEGIAQHPQGHQWESWLK
jgi:hypothetical protein